MVGTVPSVRQPAASPVPDRIRERPAVPRPQPGEQPARAAPTARQAPTARAAAQRTPDTRTEGGIPAWKRQIVASLEEQLDRRGTAGGSRGAERLTAGNIDERISNLSRELRGRAQERTGYAARNEVRTGVVVNRAV